MGEGTKDTLRGRAKEAAGALLDDEKLRGEGRLDQVAGDLKKKASEAVDRLREVVALDDDEATQEEED